jgi:uncharacterized membrane protein
MVELIATFAAGTFFGAAIYINLAQHPATIKTGGEFASEFFPPMYSKASTLQIGLAVLGTILGVLAWYLSSEVVWLIGAGFLVSVIPITILFIKPINDQLLDSSKQLPPNEVVDLLTQWNPRHWIRSIVSGVSFVCFLFGMSG